MKRLFIIALLFFISLCPITTSVAATVEMAFGEKIAPFCFPETDSGIEVDIIREALAFKGHVLVPRYFPFARIPVEFKNKTVDAAMTDLGEDLTPSGGFYGDPAVIYHNVFISLKARDIQITKPEDLNGLSVISFVGAAKRYPEWLTPVKQSGRYFEQNNQLLQVLTLNKGRYDLVLSDRSIFKYFSQLLQSRKNFVTQPIQEHKFTDVDPLDYRPIFNNAAIRDDFNQGLALLISSGRYQAIYDKYLNSNSSTATRP
ncbi:substrate-binding periplasmic protein [Shewanella colwelliana]|uniref:substrate-binding periplasmic protein n=1 Tax=Shewanella colwelliana TaxID=23 RepID=UPI0022AF14AF|nr:ABC transporter substrate-binding protein [Shewanella colwelliana]MCZ4335909.1 ABC transporter substrate-binding protein [Shewanella colwelliana]